MPRDPMPAPSKPVFLFSIRELTLIGITMVWGITFLLVKAALSYAGPLYFVGVRFGSAALVILLLTGPAIRGLTKRELWAGFLIGSQIFLGYELQTWALMTIPAAKSAFITALYVPLVPIFQWLFLRKRPHLMSWLGVGFAFLGLLCLAGPDDVGGGFGLGEWLTVISTLAIAGEIILISRYAGKVNLKRVTVVQLAVTALLAFALMPVAGEAIPPFSWFFIVTAIGLGIASALIQLGMNWAQQHVSATRASVIYAGEPVWAGIASRIVGERMPGLAILGGALIVVGVIVSELRFGKGKGKA